MFSLFCLIYFSSASLLDNCPRLIKFFDFQDENNSEENKEVTTITHIQGSTLVAVGT